ncbi:hypothetical protein GCM10010515_47210 [Streptomyces fructofermentans]|uniref:Secreted protein n=1 Tax=Streptomyces fructofermentans TaxID=152141 RepID=A0A918NK64_9ACTN|nr:hypothetical protein GCM10010515_47210 [Streptomyces fructofermentans]
MAGLTAAALAVIAFFAYQASAHAPGGIGSGVHADSGSTSSTKSPRDRRHPTALPARSGKGPRVVYSVDDDRVWLVGKGDRVQRTFRVTPGTVDPVPAAYVVSSRSGSITGSDGVDVEHVVRFANVDDIVIGFSAAVDGSVSDPDPSQKVGGIRSTRADGDALWGFATIGTKVVVIR